MASKEDAQKEYSNVPATVPEFSLAGKCCWARVVSIYDADTITVIMPMANTYYRFSLRIAGIDSCEIKSKNSDTKALAYKARNRVYELVTGTPWTGDEYAPKAQLEARLRKDVNLAWVECDAPDKYGRVLATVRATPGGASFADCLIAEKLAYAYGGGTKLSETEQAQKLTNVQTN